MPHQFSGGFRGADNTAVGGHQIVAEPGSPAESAIGQRPDAGADRAAHEVWNQQHLAADELSVVAHQQESAIGG